MKKIILYISCCVLVIVFDSCKKLIEIDTPKTQLTPDKVFADDISANAAMSAIYVPFNSLINANVSNMLGLYCDELETSSSDVLPLEYSAGAVSTGNSNNLNMWKGLYGVIYQCNALLEYIDMQPRVSEGTRKQLKGEALFLRALCHFYLTNIYGDVPIIVNTDVRISSKTGRDKSTEVYSQVIKDLQGAHTLLGTGYVNDERVRANQYAADALLAKVYLYQQDWGNAVSYANAVLNTGSYVLSDEVSTIFKHDSKEAILAYWTPNGYTQTGASFIPEGTTATYLLSASLLNSFESGDLRKVNWVGINNGTEYFPFKYRLRSSTVGADAEYLILLRAADLYLIRAEANAKLNQLESARADLNIIRNRAGLEAVVINNQQDLINAIMKERRIEFFSEWGERFFDLKRTGLLNDINSGNKTKWKSNGVLLPIPQYELLNNPSLTQNPGY